MVPRTRLMVPGCLTVNQPGTGFCGIFRHLKKSALIFVFVLLWRGVFAQSDSYSTDTFYVADVAPPKIHSPEIGIRPQIGFLMAHHTQMQYLVQGHVKLYELYAEKVVAGNKKWHHVYRMPTVGVSLILTDMGNPGEMGYGIAALTYVKYHLIKQKKFGLGFRAGGGFAYLSKWFDRVDNNKNSAIAAPYNVCLSLAVEPEWHFKKFDLGLILSFTHFSNGAYKTPNLGFNFPAIGLQMGYKFNNYVPQHNKKAQLLVFQKQHTLEVTALAGEKEIMPANGPKYFAGDINVLFRRQYHPKNNLLLYADLSYNAGYRKSYENWYKVSVDAGKALRAGIGIGYGLSMDRFMLFVHNGFYVYDPLNYDGDFYHRIGGRYNFDNGFILNLSLKTHFGKADVVELGLGYSVLKKTIKKSLLWPGPGEKF